MKRYMKIEQIPIIGCEIKNLEVKSNRGTDLENNNLNDAIRCYQEDQDHSLIYIGIKDYNGLSCEGINVEEAEELVETLQAMIKIIKN